METEGRNADYDRVSKLDKVGYHQCGCGCTDGTLLKGKPKGNHSLLGFCQVS